MASIEIKFRLIALEDVEFFIHNPSNIDHSLVNSDQYAAKLDTEIEFSEAEQTIAITLAFNLKSRVDSERESTSGIGKPSSTEDQFPSLRYKGTAKFSVGGEFKLALESSDKGDGYNVPTQLIVRLSDIAYSTFRGIIFSKSSGTPLRNVMIPVMSAKQIAMFVTPRAEEV